MSSKRLARHLTAAAAVAGFAAAAAAALSAGPLMQKWKENYCTKTNRPSCGSPHSTTVGTQL